MKNVLIIICSILFLISCSKNSQNNTNDNLVDTTGQNIKLIGIGLNQSGGNVIFKLNGGGSNFEKFDFPDSIIGRNITFSGGLCKASNGLFYGISAQGGRYNQGTIFMFDPNNNSAIKLMDLNNTTVGYQYPKFTEGYDGKLYSYGSFYNILNYALIKLDPTTNAISFPWIQPLLSATLGGNVFCRSINGKLYGVTDKAPNNSPNQGGIIEYSISDSSLIYRGDIPFSLGKSFAEQAICEAQDGNFYFLASGNGNSNLGTIIQYNSSNNSYSKVHDFSDPNNVSQGLIGHTGLLRLDNNKLIGLTQAGGIDSAGTVFTFDIQSHDFSTLYTFRRSGQTGLSPRKLLSGTNQIFFGLATGKIFKFNASNNNCMAIHNFEDNTIISPVDLILY